MKKSNIKATTLRTTMIVLLFIVIGLSITGFYFTQDWLGKFATEINSTAPKSTVGSTNAEAIKQLQDDIAKHQADTTKADAIIASSKDYQSQVTQDLNKYASSASVMIANYSFAQSAGTALTPLTGLQTSSATITLTNPVPFTNFMKFLKAIESNLPKMQLTGIDLTPATGSNDAVTVKPLTIEVYTR
jgi:hypothetical protein